SRRDFIQTSVRASLFIAIGGLGALGASRATASHTVWQIDPFKCTQCGRCATECVMAESAVKCIHAYDICGYCDLCGGYLKPDANDRATGGENQLCPTAAISRNFIEEPYFEYVIDEALCIGCAKCVKGCTAFGNGSFHLQIRHDRCLDCNECAIARVCPSEAISRISIKKPYLIKGKFEVIPSVEPPKSSSKK
ncbi:MAG: ferredoxin, partial [Bacteroidetes bacterium]|nr:ferredoxin [Bacteroidota bacterium]